MWKRYLPVYRWQAVVCLIPSALRDRERREDVPERWRREDFPKRWRREREREREERHFCGILLHGKFKVSAVIYSDEGGWC